MKNKILIFSLACMAFAVLIASLISPKGVRAQYNTAQETKSISVDKKVRSIQDNVYLDNIDKSKKIFFTGDILEFAVTVENTGKDTLNNIKMVDSLPSYLELIFSPGIYNKTSNSIEWTIDKLNPAEIKTYNVRTKITSYKLASTNKMTNHVNASVNNINDSDDASYFIGVTTVPVTGDNSLIIKTALVLVLGFGGLYFRKFARGY